MAKGRGEGFGYHFSMVRLRVTGSGNLQLTLNSYQDVVTQNLVDVPMQATTNREFNRLCNLTDQHAQLEIKTTEIDETFRIGKIVIFVKPVTTGEFPS